ncbi:hypothetical protein WA158_007727 [Blastocystis sp. Blastoise]
MYKLHCVVQNYLWGKAGHESRVALLKHADDDSYEVSEDKHYAEYWFGTHPSGPSSIEVDGSIIPLKEYLNSHPELMGTSMGEHGDLPFLYKVLSVGAALSIQAHPDKVLAKHLHAINPTAYTDDNHKPEMALALGPFEAMCGFRCLSEIAVYLKEIKPLYNIIGKETADRFIKEVETNSVSDEKLLLKSLFKQFIECPKEIVLQSLKEHRDYLEHKSNKSQMENTILEVMDTYPGDAGSFAPYILNYLQLSKGDSIYLGANIPHAYLKGDIMESMACSNNVVRAGLTPKFIDKETLINMCTYENGPVNINKGESIDKYTSLYSTPAPEFEIEYTHIPSDSTYILPIHTVPSICVVTSGNASIHSETGSMNIKEGSILFHAASSTATITTTSNPIDIYTTHEKL